MPKVPRRGGEGHIIPGLGGSALPNMTIVDYGKDWHMFPMLGETAAFI